MPPRIDPEKCVRCGTCAEICVTDCYGPAQRGSVPAIRYPMECWHCRSCVMDCPAGAISMYYPIPLSILYKEKDPCSAGGAV